MGTRNLTAVMIDGEYKIAQYGQWDGYPSGQGSTILEFLQQVDIGEFKKNVKECNFLTQSELEGLGEDWKQNHPHLSRDAGGEILQYVMNGARGLKNSIGFAGDSLFCEYAYVVDLDTLKLEIYEGFNEGGVVTEGRFRSDDEALEKTEKWGPVTFLKEYSLLNLPTDEQFVAELEPDDEDELE